MLFYQHHFSIVSFCVHVHTKYILYVTYTIDLMICRLGIEGQVGKFYFVSLDLQLVFLERQ